MDTPVCSVCGGEVTGDWFMGFDRPHCSPHCREITVRHVEGGQVPGCSTLASVLKHKEDEKRREEEREKTEKLQKEEWLRRVQMEALASIVKPNMDGGRFEEEERERAQTVQRKRREQMLRKVKMEARSRDMQREYDEWAMWA